jgi:hypothetical protein
MTARSLERRGAFRLVCVAVLIVVMLLMWLASALAEPLPVPKPDPAAAIPVQYRGEWCENGPFYLPRRLARCKRHSETWIRITDKLYEGGEWNSRWSCPLVSIAAEKPSEFIDHAITFNCGVVDGPVLLNTYWFSYVPAMKEGRDGAVRSRGARLYVEVAKEKGGTR